MRVFIGMPRRLCFLAMLAASMHAQPPLKNSIEIEFVTIAPGEFMMGCSEGDSLCAGDESPRHRVQITKPFEMGKYEVTQEQWMAVMHDNPSGQKGPKLPVETVSKLDAQQFITKLNDLNDGYHYRLPTEAEWEYAARADGASVKLDEIAWYSANSDDETHPVGTKKPNAWGLFDMQGNVREWVSDLYSADFYSQSPTADPSGPTPEQYSRNTPLGPPGRGGRGGRGPLPPVPASVELPADATPQQQIDALRKEVTQLRDEVRQLRDLLATAGPPGRGGPGRGGPGGGGPGGALGNPVPGPAALNSNGGLFDPLDGLPTGLPVVRGGGWDQSAAFQRVSARYTYYGPTLKVSDIGFRVVRYR